MEQFNHIRGFEEAFDESFQEENTDLEKVIFSTQTKEPVISRVVFPTKNVNLRISRVCNRCQFPNTEEAWYCCRCGALLMKYWECAKCFQKNLVYSDQCSQCGSHKESI